MNGKEIHVSDIRDVKDAFVITELPYNHLQYKTNGSPFDRSALWGSRWYSNEWFDAAAICYVAIGAF